MSKRTLMMVIAMAVSLLIATTGTLAYLSDTDSDVNVMTLGKVDIEQIEEKWNADHTALETFTNSPALLPVVGETNVVDNEGGYDYDTFKNIVDKYVSVKNVGRTDAYLRTVIAFEMGDATQEQFAQWVQIRKNVGDWTWKAPFEITIEGKKYLAYEVVYGKALEAGATTIPSLKQVYMVSDCGNDEVDKLDGDDDGFYKIYVVSQAVQAAGFDNSEKTELENAQNALDTSFGPLSAASHPWMDDDAEGDQEPDGKTSLVSNADELVEALEAGNDVIMTADIKIDPAGMSNAYGTTGINVKNGQMIDGGGYTLDIKGAGGTWDSGINTTGGTIKNIKVTGSFRGIFVNHTSTHSEPVVLENVTTDGTVYTISCDQGMNQNLVATDCTFNGWTSYAATIGNAKFVNCNFGAGSGYMFCRPYAPTEFVGCDFVEDYEMDPRAAVTFENCTLNGVPLTAENLATLVTSNIANATVK